MRSTDRTTRSRGANSHAPTARSGAAGMRSPATSISSESAAYRPRSTLLRRSAGGRNPPMTSVLVAAQNDLLEVFELLEDLAGPQHDTRERILGDPDVQIGHLAQQEVEASQQRPAPSHEDPSVHDVGRELRRRALEGLSKGVHNAADRLLECLADLDARDPERARNAAHQIAALDLHVHLLGERERRADLD